MDVKTKSLEPIFRNLERLYRNPKRFYHNFDHIQDMLVKFDSIRYLSEHPDRIQLVIWFHDAVYDAQKRDNEVRSADMWSRKMTPFLVSNVLQWGKRAILATIDHLPNSDPDIQLLLDLDLSRLGAPWEVFQNDRANIRKEYAHVDSEIFNKTSKTFFDKLLKRPAIYGIQYWYNLLEKQARENLRRLVSA